MYNLFKISQRVNSAISRIYVLHRNPFKWESRLEIKWKSSNIEHSLKFLEIWMFFCYANWCACRQLLLAGHFFFFHINICITVSGKRRHRINWALSLQEKISISFSLNGQTWWIFILVLYVYIELLLQTNSPKFSSFLRLNRCCWIE